MGSDFPNEGSGGDPSEELFGKIVKLAANLDASASFEIEMYQAWISFAYLVDENLIVLQGHAILERLLPGLLNSSFVNKCNFDHNFRPYSTQLRLAMYLGLLDGSEYAALDSLEKLRDGVAHGKRGRVVPEDVTDLHASLLKAPSFASVLGSCPKPENFPDSLKTLVFTIGLVLKAKRVAAENREPGRLTWSTAEADAVSTTLAAVEKLSAYGAMIAIARALLRSERQIETGAVAALEAIRSNAGIEDAIKRLATAVQQSMTPRIAAALKGDRGFNLKVDFNPTDQGASPTEPS
jgi:hypothetical protein